MNQLKEQNAVVVGASSGIARALIRRLVESDSQFKVAAISRSNRPHCFSDLSDEQVLWKTSDYGDGSMAQISHELSEKLSQINRMFICNGVLHQDAIFPEKRLKDVSRDNLSAVHHINAIVPILWLQHLLPLLNNSTDSVVTVFSARVGSIEDNLSGGWHAYRASKASLNMMLKSVAIEHRRFSRNTKFLAFHPGTTDTELSKPFQDRLKEGQLFKPEFVADRLLRVVEDLPDKPALNYLDWAGETIAW